MATIWICPGSDGVVCNGEVVELKETAFNPLYGIIKPENGCVGKNCGKVMPKNVLKGKYVWSPARLEAWERIKKIKFQGEPLLQSHMETQEECKISHEKVDVPQKCLDGIFCFSLVGEVKPATQEDLVKFFSTPIFSTSEIMIGKRKVILDYSSGVEAMIKRGRRVVWRGSGEELRAMVKTSPTVALMDWAAKSSR